MKWAEKLLLWLRYHDLMVNDRPTSHRPDIPELAAVYAQ